MKEAVPDILQASASCSNLIRAQLHQCSDAVCGSFISYVHVLVCVGRAHAFLAMGIEM